MSVLQNSVTLHASFGLVESICLLYEDVRHAKDRAQAFQGSIKSAVLPVSSVSECKTAHIYQLDETLQLLDLNCIIPNHGALSTPHDSNTTEPWNF